MADNNEKLFTLKEVLDIVSKTNAITAQDLVEATEGKEFTDSKALLDVINPIAVSKRNELIDREFNKAKGKVSKKVEKRLAEIFQDEDFEGKDVDAILEMLPTKVKPQTNNSTKLTIEQALQIEGVKKLIDAGQKATEELKVLKGDFESYKSNQKVLQKAVAEAEKQGAQFSSDPVIRARQIKAFEAEVTRFKYQEDAQGNLTPLDDEGQYPRHNATTGKEFAFSEFIKGLSPVDFKAEQQAQADKSIPLPNNNANVQNHGFTSESLKNVGLKEYQQAINDGHLAKAEFIKKTITERAENGSKT